MEERKVYKLLVGKPERKTPLGNANGGMELVEIDSGGVDWTRLAQDSCRWWAPANKVMILRVLAPRI
jgi:hypothetical protein